VIAGFHREVDDTYSLQGCYAAYDDNSLLTFRYNLPVVTKLISWISWPFKGQVVKFMGYTPDPCFTPYVFFWKKVVVNQKL